MKTKTKKTASTPEADIFEQIYRAVRRGEDSFFRYDYLAQVFGTERVRAVSAVITRLLRCDLHICSWSTSADGDHSVYIFAPRLRRHDEH